MPRKESSPKLHEPYEDYLYADLRHELTVRSIRLIRTGPQRVTRRAGFISLLRDWDKAHGNQKTETAPTQTKNQKPTQKRKPAAMTPTTRTVRARRGCRFRLINVLLSPDFNGRWGEMATGAKEVTQLWLDVHAAYLAENSMLDALHFEDALFVNVTPEVVLAHSAARLQQMWTEILAMYRAAVTQAKDAAAHNDNVHSFFDFCAGRLDLLYLHMAMLLEPKLSELIVSDGVIASDSKVKPAATPKGLKKGKVAVDKREAVTKATAKVPATKPAMGSAGVVVPAPVKMPAGLTQNPEMVELPTPAKNTAVSALSKSVAAKLTKSSALAKQVKPPASTRKPVIQKKAVGKSKLTISSAEAKPKPSPTLMKLVATPPKAKASTKPSQRKSPPGTERLANGKRPREEEVSMAIVAVPTAGPVSDIVPHSGNKRVNTTTTISTLATRPTDMMFPPDEWDILEKRLRKVNENIDRCHRGLASNEGNVSDSYKQSLDADLRFYSAIKQRLQEQLLVLMQSGY